VLQRCIDGKNAVLISLDTNTLLSVEQPLYHLLSPTFLFTLQFNPQNHRHHHKLFKLS